MAEVNLFDKYCSKCKHMSVIETEMPCVKCIDDFVKDWRNPNRRLMGFKKVLMRMKDKNEQQAES